jgi:hypothetical protein
VCVGVSDSVGASALWVVRGWWMVCAQHRTPHPPHRRQGPAPPPPYIHRMGSSGRARTRGSQASASRHAAARSVTGLLRSYSYIVGPVTVRGRVARAAWVLPMPRPVPRATPACRSSRRVLTCWSITRIAAHRSMTTTCWSPRPQRFASWTHAWTHAPCAPHGHGPRRACLPWGRGRGCARRAPIG